MKDICHEELSRLVGTSGSAPLKPEVLEIIIKASLEPDQIYRKKILNDLMANLEVPLEWLINHTIRAKSIAIQCIQEACTAKIEGSREWRQYLGWAFHFIADWGTPHHSPVSKSNPVPLWTSIGAIIGGILGSFGESENLGQTLASVAKGALIGAGITGSAGALKLAIDHSIFEEECGRLCITYRDSIEGRFNELKEKIDPEQHFGTLLRKLEVKLDDLRRFANILEPDWMETCSELEFSRYIVKIAKVMDFACQLVMMGCSHE